ncbi:unnamed protein product [Caenorhabditis auriculariae]|uniref:Uncharacterized protein n=1 Tax=Caenorhabditis auriculariae TaxID=2777116 RepID=A0A8S1GQX8_9PELO|nr:unnamed protein product [Caenorhabditis auriculariae]
MTVQANEMSSPIENSDADMPVAADEVLEHVDSGPELEKDELEEHRMLGQGKNHPPRNPPLGSSARSVPCQRGAKRNRRKELTGSPGNVRRRQQVDERDRRKPQAEAKHGDDLNAVSSTTSENPFVGNYAELTIESNTSTIAPLETTGTNVPKKEVQEEVYEKKNEELTVVESSGVEAENFEMENRTSTVVSTGNSESDNSAEMMEKDEGSAEPDGDETSTESVKIKNSTEESANRSAEIVLESAENFTYESSEPFEAKMTVEAFLQTIPEMHVTANDNTPTTSSSTTTLASTTVTDASVKNCPLPRLCAKNCFIAINEDGCQDCQCLWQSIICESDSDCPDRQLCDLGHCNCKPGFKQDMRHSAKCEVDLEHSLKTNGDETHGIKTQTAERPFPAMLKRPEFSSAAFSSFSTTTSATATTEGVENVSENEEYPVEDEQMAFPSFTVAPIFSTTTRKERKSHAAHVLLPSKFTTVEPLAREIVERFEEENRESTPIPAPFEQHLEGVWYPMRKGDIPHLGIFGGELRRAPQKQGKSAEKRLYHEYTRANRRGKPVKVEVQNARKLMNDECETREGCGPRMVCCKKRWCDKSKKCGIARFCLPSCDTTKLTFLPSEPRSVGIIDIIYD